MNKNESPTVQGSGWSYALSALHRWLTTYETLKFRAEVRQPHKSFLAIIFSSPSCVFSLKQNPLFFPAQITQTPRPIRCQLAFTRGFLSVGTGAKPKRVQGEGGVGGGKEGSSTRDDSRTSQYKALHPGRERERVRKAAAA